MADTSNSTAQSPGFTDKLKSWLSWSWTYIWAIWFAMVLVLIYVLRSPLKLQETLATGKSVSGAAELARRLANVSGLAAAHLLISASLVACLLNG